VILKRPKLVFIDEATSAVDLKTDQLIQQTIRKVFSKSTVLTIAHRLETIKFDSDRILIMDQGRVMAIDIPQNIFENNNNNGIDLKMLDQ